MENDNPLENKDDFSLTLEHLKSEDNEVYQDFISIRDSFSREIETKDQKRRSLLERIDQLKLSESENLKKDSTLDKNIQIYDKNRMEMEKRMVNLEKKEVQIKKNYSTMVQGSKGNSDRFPGNPQPALSPDTFYEMFKDSVKTHRSLDKSNLTELQNEKETFLETLRNQFEKYDNELMTIDNEKTKLKKLFEEIETKRKNAEVTRQEIEENNILIASQISKNKKELRFTVSEEKYLIAAFQKIVQNVKADIKVSDTTMEILLSSVSDQTKDK